jgi:dihydrodipicolinate synthase/N-acetylneuraminate lyase
VETSSKTRSTGNTAATDLGAVASYSARYRPRRGLSIPSVTIVDHTGRVIEDEQRRLFQYIAQDGMGADIIFACGTTGEARWLRNSERQRLVSIQADEISRINDRLTERSLAPIEAWAGVTADTRSETLANIEHSIEAGVDAAVVAPLSIGDCGDIVQFFQRQISDLFDRLGRWVPIFLYDNADIAVDPHVPHIRTRDVKRLSRLPFVYGIKVSASRRVLGNYTKGAGHFKDKGEFGIYVGNAMLMFRVFRVDDGLAGVVREYWNRYLLHNELPIGVVSGPANVWPREWQRAWRACYAGDEHLAAQYKRAFKQFGDGCHFESSGERFDKTISCIKYALKRNGVISSDLLTRDEFALTQKERELFDAAYRLAIEELPVEPQPLWRSGV